LHDCGEDADRRHHRDDLEIVAGQHLSEQHSQWRK